MSEQRPTARVVLRYGFEEGGRFIPEILAVDLLDVPPPLSENEIPEGGADATWLDVLAPGGELAFRIQVPAPDIGPETLDAGGALVRKSADGPHGTSAVVEIPWFGDGTRIVFRHAIGSERSTRSVPGLASLELSPTEPSLERKADEAVRLKVWGHDNKRAIVLLFLAEAFKKEEEEQFKQAVETCLEAIGETLKTVSPSRDLRRAFAPVRLMLASKESGIGVKRRKTALGAHWRDSAPDQRLILIDEEKVTKHRSAIRGQSVQAIAIVNEQRYGGSGGATSVTSCDPAAMGEVLVHELGHSLFRLGDEYVDQALVPKMGEPVAVNVCGQFTPATLKWRNLLTPGVALPTLPGGASGTVGAYEGAFYAASGRFRPSFTCKMRDVVENFCPVCADAITQRLSPHL